MTALEMQFAAANIVRRALDAGGPSVTNDGHYRALLASAAVYAPIADTYTWSPEILSAVFMASKTIPPTSVLTRAMLPPSLHSWWWFEGGTPYVGVSRNEDYPHAIGALLLATRDTDECLDVMSFAIDTTGGIAHPIPATRWVWPFGASIESVLEKHPDHHSGQRLDQSTLHVRHFGRIVIAALAWMQQRIISTDSGHIERHRGKQIAREHDVAPPADVKIIQLRRVESQLHEPTPEGADPVEWSCRWIVNGHWRNQPYADGPKLIYIMPFVKGPADKPLRVPSHTVYSVNR